MKFYNSTFSSKNKKSLNKFFTKFFNDTYISEPKIIKKYFQKQNKIKRFAILKSPHVNKTAQEQFEIRESLKQISVFQPKHLKYLYILKKIKNNALSDIKIKTKFSFNADKAKRLSVNVLQPQNFSLNVRTDMLTQKLKLNTFKNQKFKKFKEKTLYKGVNSFLTNLCAFGELKILSKSK